MNAYPSYKNIGVEWISMIPSHWETKCLWTISKIKSITDNDHLELLSVYLDKGVIRFSEVNEKRTNATSENKSKYQKVEPGNLVLNNQQAWRGSVGVSQYTGIVSPAYYVLEISKQFDSKYANYLFRDKSMIGFYVISSKGIGTIQRNLFYPFIRTIPVLMPPLPEQKHISNYLGQKTQQIDSLIEKAEQKIELLNEQRISLINTTVTKGLDPNIKMKDSGVEWIGEIPSAWTTKRMCYVFKTISINNTSNELNLSVYRDYGVILTDSRDDNRNVISEDISNYKLVEVGDFVMNKMKCWMGSLGLSDYRGIVSPSYTVMKPLIKNVHRYIHYLLRSNIYIPQYKRLSYGVRIGQWDLRFEDFRNLPCIIPPLLEQQQIVEYLDKKIVAIDRLKDNESKRIDLLNEYRQALISEVVTGKIDVRNEVFT